MVLRPKRLSCENVYRQEVRRGRCPKDFYQTVRKKQFIIPSQFGYDISCELLEPDNKQQEAYTKLAILLHGFCHAKYGCLVYARMYLKLGFTVLIYDHRNHGLSGRAYTSMGYYEKYDLKRLVDWCYKTYGSECRIVTHGESMGAATALLHLEIDDRVKCVISDCAYSDLKQLLEHLLKNHYHLPPVLVPLESLVTFLRAGFWYGEVSPIRAVSRSDTPILFIHGKKDRFVPTHMSMQMYACKKNKKSLYLVAKARHAESCLANRSGYEKKVKDFLDRYYY